MLTQTQFEERKQGIGGSDVAALLGVSKWKTPIELYLEKIGEKENNAPETDVQRRGNRLEEFVVEDYERTTGRQCEKVLTTQIHDSYPWMRANIDRIVVGESAILECKTTRSYVIKEAGWGEEGSGEVPLPYVMQCAHYAAVCNVDRVDIGVLIDAETFKLYHYDRNRVLEDLLIIKEKTFWEEHVLKRIPPKPMTIADCSLIFPSSLPNKTICANELLLEKVQNLKEMKAALKEQEKKAKELQLEVMDYMGDAAVLVDEDEKTLVSWKDQTTRRLDIARLKEEAAEMYQSFVKPFSSRVFRIK